LRLQHAVAFSKKLPWFELTKVISLKMQPHAGSGCVKRSSQRSLKVVDLSRIATRIFSVCLMHAIASSKKLCWLVQTKVITLKMQPHAVNARWKRVSQCGFTF